MRQAWGKRDERFHMIVTVRPTIGRPLLYNVISPRQEMMVMYGYCLELFLLFDVFDDIALVALWSV